MVLDFEKFAMKGNEFLHHLEANLGIEDRAHAARILRSTFKVFRNHLAIEESLHLVAQLPMAIKGVYVDGWSPGEYCRITSTEDFILEIIKAEGKSAWRDFSSSEEILESVRAVIGTMKLYVSPEEINQALRTFPAKIYRSLETSEAEETY
jgi:uncharacterized protein (DUF2267 family)